MVSYEESRKKRVEENKKRMEQLNLHALSQSLNNSPSKTNTIKKKKMPSELGVTSVRRSARSVDKPPPNYKDFYPLDLLGGRARQPHRRPLKDDFYASAEEKAYAIERADHLQSTLPSQFPSFVKPMLHSHVSGGFWLSLPVSFSNTHLPKQDVTITLLDEDDQPWEAKYLAYKNGLSGGWRTFSMDHNLRDGDALVFQLLQPLSFKVHIIRVVPNEQEQDKNASEAANATKLRATKRSKRD